MNLTSLSDVKDAVLTAGARITWSHLVHKCCCTHCHSHVLHILPPDAIQREEANGRSLHKRLENQRPITSCSQLSELQHTALSRVPPPPLAQNAGEGGA